MEDLNRRIDEEICRKTIAELSDQSLMDEYKNCPSVKRRISVISDILDKQNLEESVKQKILEEYIPELIPPGTKGVVRGNRFNQIVKGYILSLNLGDEYDIQFEKTLEESGERPDWYIKKGGKTLIGMNQIDIWGGGQQLNRGDKYINRECENTLLVSVICGEKKFKTTDTRAYDLVSRGFNTGRLCYLNGLKRIITEYFA